VSEKKILVVDDEEMIRDIFEQAFTIAGYSVRLSPVKKSVPFKT